MKSSIFVIISIVAVALLFAAGCTQPQSTPATPTVTPVQTPVQTVSTPPVTIPQAGMGTPGPTEMLPVNYNLEFQVQGNGDTSNPIMAVTIRGGNGLNFDSQVDVTLTKPDGTAQSQSMYAPFHVGQFVAFPCSTDKNRVEIWVTAPTVGKIKVYDDIVPFKQLNP